MTPTQFGAALAAMQAAAIPSGDLTTGLKTTRTGIESDSSRPAAIRSESAGDLPQGLLAVQVLAAGQEPDLELAQSLHRVTPQSSCRAQM